MFKREFAETQYQTAAATTYTFFSDGIPTDGEADYMVVQVVCEGQALDAFAMQVKTDSSDTAEWVTLKSASWDTASEVLLWTTGDIAALASSTPGVFAVDVRGFYRVRFTASNAVGAATSITISGTYVGDDRYARPT